MTEASGSANRSTMAIQQPADPQANSIFFRRLPQELRDMIYAFVFSATTLVWAPLCPDRDSLAPIPARPHVFALLHTCRRTNDEIGDTWIHFVLFAFQDVEVMFWKLRTLEPDLLAKLRHVRVLGCYLWYGRNPEVRRYRFCYRIDSMLNILKGLQLDTLTVLGLGPNVATYDELEYLLEESWGWKELRFVNWSVCMIDEVDDDNWQVDQGDACWEWLRWPGTRPWMKILVERDGAESEPYAQCYCSPFSDTPLAVLDPKTRVLLNPIMGPLTQYPGHPVTERLRQGGVEIMAVLRRGNGVDYRVTNPPDEMQEPIDQGSSMYAWQYEESERAYEDAATRWKDTW